MNIFKNKIARMSFILSIFFIFTGCSPGNNLFGSTPNTNWDFFWLRGSKAEFTFSFPHEIKAYEKTDFPNEDNKEIGRASFIQGDVEIPMISERYINKNGRIDYRGKPTIKLYSEKVDIKSQNIAYQVDLLATLGCRSPTHQMRVRKVKNKDQIKVIEDNCFTVRDGKIQRWDIKTGERKQTKLLRSGKFILLPKE